MKSTSKSGDRMKKLVLTSLSLLCGITSIAYGIKENHNAQTTRSGCILTSPLIPILDGLFINATQIKMMLAVHNKLKQIIYGEKNKAGVLEGRYIFEGIKHSVKSLVLIENQKDTDYINNRAALLTDPAKNQNAIQTLDQEYNKSKQELRACLLAIKKEFEEKVAPFEKNARGAKDQMLYLMTESCQKHNHPDSALLKWADTQEGNEMAYMRDHINTLQAFDQFCGDLLNFLEDLMRSCPKAWKQFKQQLEAAKQNQTNGTK